MISSFGFMAAFQSQESLDLHVYGMEISLFKPNLPFTKLTFSSRGTVSVLQTDAFSNSQTDNNRNFDGTNILFEKAY